MQIVRSIHELGPAVAQLKARGRLALVPTMGALHAGHLALIAAAKQAADRVAATIFVNPAQFAADEDLDRYPRQEEADARMLGQAGCDLLWLPSVADIYPAGFATTVHVAGASDRWEGAARPGHFNGVATVVSKLLLATGAEAALFGEKDFQQLAVIRRMVADLNIACEIIGLPTVRDSDGLALSSRNAFLSRDERMRAAALPKTLNDAAEAIRQGDAVKRVLAEGEAKLRDAGFSRIDYFALVDAETLLPIEVVSGAARLLAAATIGTTRLIDNVPV